MSRKCRLGSPCLCVVTCFTPSISHPPPSHPCWILVLKHTPILRQSVTNLQYLPHSRWVQVCQILSLALEIWCPGFVGFSPHSQYTGLVFFFFFLSIVSFLGFIHDTRSILHWFVLCGAISGSRVGKRCPIFNVVPPLFVCWVRKSALCFPFLFHIWWVSLLNFVKARKRLVLY